MVTKLNISKTFIYRLLILRFPKTSCFSQRCTIVYFNYIDKGNFVILILTHDKVKGDGPNKPINIRDDNSIKSMAPPRK